MTELAKELGYSRQTLYNWKREIPDFKERVLKSKHTLILTNTGDVWNKVYLKAVNKLDVNAMRIYLTNFDPNFVDPFSRKK